MTDFESIASEIPRYAKTSEMDSDRIYKQR